MMTMSMTIYIYIFGNIQDNVLFLGHEFHTLASGTNRFLYRDLACVHWSCWDDGTWPKVDTCHYFDRSSVT